MLANAVGARPLLPPPHCPRSLIRLPPCTCAPLIDTAAGAGIRLAADRHPARPDGPRTHGHHDQRCARGRLQGLRPRWHRRSGRHSVRCTHAVHDRNTLCAFPGPWWWPKMRDRLTHIAGSAWTRAQTEFWCPTSTMPQRHARPSPPQSTRLRYALDLPLAHALHSVSSTTRPYRHPVLIVLTAYCRLYFSDRRR